MNKNRRDRLPLTYDECRARFRRAAWHAGVPVEAHPIDPRGPFGQELTIDVAQLGESGAKRVLVVLSGVHGVEGFAPSEAQSELLARADEVTAALPDDVAVVIVHVVNPWGMAHGRRQNESNVDLNRNWRRSDDPPVHNDAYDEIHHLACPDTPDLPTADDLLAVVAPVLAERGEAWIRAAITRGQYRHADGLHYGGERTEASNLVLERVLPPRLAAAEKVLTLDLHTGDGATGEIVLLSAQPPGSEQDRFLRSAFGPVVATQGDADASTVAKSGSIANGLGALVSGAQCHAVVLEVGTAGDLEQLVATYQEQWVYRRGDLTIPEHQAARARYRDCFTPDDADWEAAARAGLRDYLDRALDAISGW